MRVVANAAAFRGRRIESRTPDFRVLDHQFGLSCDDLAIEPLSERIGQVAQPVRKHFCVDGAGGCERLPFVESDERYVVLIADLHGDALIDQFRVGQLAGHTAILRAASVRAIGVCSSAHGNQRVPRDRGRGIARDVQLSVSGHRRGALEGRTG
jgi:hypothetical protein